MFLKINNLILKIFRKLISYLKIRIHYGLVFCYDINIIKKITNSKSNAELIKSPIKIVQCNNSIDIYNYYNKNGKYIPEEVIADWLLNDYRCWLAYSSNEIAGISWTWTGKVHLQGLSGRAFSKKKTIEFEEDTFYICHVHVDRKYRGQNIMAKLEIEQLKFHLIENNYSKGVITMGIDNIPSVKTQTKLGGKLIVVSFMLFLLNIQFRKYLYFERKEKCWN